MQKATLISTCSFRSQWLGPTASEAEPGFGSPLGGNYSTLRSTLSVERGTGPTWVDRSKVPSVPIAPSWPQMVCHTPPCSTPGRWLQILPGPLSILLAKSHIPEQHMFHLKPTRFALPSGAKEKTLAQAAHF